MADTAAQLVDRVLPRVALRQWVLSLPFSRRFAVAWPPMAGSDRERWERLCRYVARPAIATERLHELPDGRVAYDLRHTWSDGTSRVVLQPLTFLEKLAAPVPTPRAHLVTYHGAVPGPRAPAAAWRSTIVPGPSTSRRRRASARCGPPRRYL